MKARVRDVIIDTCIGGVYFTVDMRKFIGAELEFQDFETFSEGFYKSNGFTFHESWLDFIDESEINNACHNAPVDTKISKMVSDFVHQPDHYASGSIESDVFIKHDNSKPSGFHLIPKEALIGMARVLDYGAKKYAPDNWKNCDDINRYKDALWRHMLDWQGGEECDSESKLKHLYHMMCNAAFLIWFEENK